MKSLMLEKTYKLKKTSTEFSVTETSVINFEQVVVHFGSKTKFGKLDLNL